MSGYRGVSLSQEGISVTPERTPTGLRYRLRESPQTPGVWVSKIEGENLVEALRQYRHYIGKANPHDISFAVIAVKVGADALSLEKQERLMEAAYQRQFDVLKEQNLKRVRAGEFQESELELRTLADQYVTLMTGPKRAREHAYDLAREHSEIEPFTRGRVAYRKSHETGAKRGHESRDGHRRMHRRPSGYTSVSIMWNARSSLRPSNPWQ